MRYGIFINQAMCLKWGITGKKANAAHVFSILHEAHAWAEEVVICGQVYYWTSRKAICDELAYLQLKPDTVYRHLKFLDELGIIDYMKQGKKDCIRITPEGKKWNKIQDKSSPEKLGSKSESRKQIRKNSEVNPKKLGSKSENDSDLNPTYKSTNKDQSTIDQKTTHKVCASENENSDLSEKEKKESSPPPEIVDTFPGRVIRYLNLPTTPEFYTEAFEALFDWKRKKGVVIDFDSRTNAARNIDHASELFNLLRIHRKIPQDGTGLAQEVKRFLEDIPEWYQDRMELSLIVKKFDKILNEQNAKKVKKSPSKTAEQWKY